MEKKELKKELFEKYNWDRFFTEKVKEDVWKWVEDKIDKAREEGYQDCLDDIWEEAKGLRGWAEHDGNVSATDIEAGLQEAYLNIEESRREIS